MEGYISEEIHFRLQHRLRYRVLGGFLVMMFIGLSLTRKCKSPVRGFFGVFCFVLQMSVQQMVAGVGETRVSTGSGVKYHYSPIISLSFFI